MGTYSGGVNSLSNLPCSKLVLWRMAISEWISENRSGAFRSPPQNDNPGRHPHHVDKLLKVACKDIQIHLNGMSWEYNVMPISLHCCCEEYFLKF